MSDSNGLKDDTVRQAAACFTCCHWDGNRPLTPSGRIHERSDRLLRRYRCHASREPRSTYAVDVCPLHYTHGDRR